MSLPNEPRRPSLCIHPCRLLCLPRRVLISVALYYFSDTTVVRIWYWEEMTHRDCVREPTSPGAVSKLATSAGGFSWLALRENCSTTVHFPLEVWSPYISHSSLLNLSTRASPQTEYPAGASCSLVHCLPFCAACRHAIQLLSSSAHRHFVGRFQCKRIKPES